MAEDRLHQKDIDPWQQGRYCLWLVHSVLMKEVSDDKWITNPTASSSERSSLKTTGKLVRSEKSLIRIGAEISVTWRTESYLSWSMEKLSSDLDQVSIRNTCSVMLKQSKILSIYSWRLRI